MFDTSVYGELVDDEASLGRVAAHVNALFLVFGSSTVRRELEETPAITLVARGKFKGLNLRELLLWVYRLLVDESGGEVKSSDLTEVVALRYLVEYDDKGKSGQMLNDFRIVAAASLQNLSLFVSADKRQISKRCVAVYVSVNTHYQLGTPELVVYADFKDFPGTYAESEEKEGAK